jgi:mono/diheme cytochrome c family protein
MPHHPPHARSREHPRRARTLAACAFVAASVLTVSCATPETTRQTSAASTASAKSPGQAVYERSCARCHGLSLQGKGNTPPIDQPKLASLGDQRLRLTIASGKGKMPAFGGLSTAQVDSLIDYLRAMT